MKKLTVIGAGNMAEALISGMLEQKMIDSKKIWITNKQNQEKLSELEKKYGVSTSYNLDELLTGAEVVMIAMKPKDVNEAMTMIKPYLSENTLLISVLAGVSIDSIELLAEKPLSIVRAMPNTSATVGKSATALSINKRVSKEQKELAIKMFETVGLTTIVREDQLDVVTGLSGSGPAYLYYLVEAMEKTAIDLGLEKHIAKDLIVQTLKGAAEMLATSPKTPSELRKEVTSPGGTTEAGLKVLASHNVQQAFTECIQEATEQSKRLGNKLKENLIH